MLLVLGSFSTSSISIFLSRPKSGKIATLGRAIKWSSSCTLAFLMRVVTIQIGNTSIFQKLAYIGRLGARRLGGWQHPTRCNPQPFWQGFEIFGKKCSRTFNQNSSLRKLKVPDPAMSQGNGGATRC